MTYSSSTKFVNLIYLGKFASIDTDEGGLLFSNTDAEKADDLIGTSVDHTGLKIVQAALKDGGDGSVADDDSYLGTSDTVTYDLGSGSLTTKTDASVEANVVVTAPDGSSQTIKVVLIQNNNGDVFITDLLNNGTLDNLQISNVEIVDITASNFSGWFSNQSVDASVIAAPVIAPPAGNAGVVDGEDTGETMGLGYDDSNAPNDGGGDKITNDADIIDGNGGNDVIDGAGGDDLIGGGAGDDTISGGAGNDTIYGDAGFGSGADAGETRESFEWSKAPGFGDEKDAKAFTQDTGTVNVSFKVLTNKSTYVEFETEKGNVDGIETGGLGPVNPNSSLAFETNDDDDKATVELSFDKAVSNVDFRVSDIDFDSQVRVRAFDENGHPISVTMTGAGSGVKLSGNDGQPGDDTATSDDTWDKGGAATDSKYSVLVEIAGPVSRIEIEHLNVGHDDSDIQISDVYFDVGPAAGEAGGPVIQGAGDDIIDGGDGNDTIFGNGGDDTIDGGTGNDTIYGDGGGSAGTAPAPFNASVTYTIPDSEIPHDGKVELKVTELPGASHDKEDAERVLLSDASGNDPITELKIKYIGDKDDPDVIRLDLRTFNDDFKFDPYDAGSEDRIEFFGADSITPLSNGETRVTYTGSDGQPHEIIVKETDAQLKVVDLPQPAVEVIPGDDTIFGGDGDDTIFGNGGNDTIDGGSGNDTIYGDGGVGSGGNLIQNGSFENTVGMTATGYGFVGTGGVPGWTTSDPNENVDIHNDDRDGVEATDGNNWLDLDASPGNIRIGQNVDGVVDGGAYTLQFDVSDSQFLPDSGGDENLVNVYWGGELIATIDPSNTGESDFQTVTLNLVGGAGNGSNRLEFEGLGKEDNIGASIDNVILTGASGSGVAPGDDTITGGDGNDIIYGDNGDGAGTPATPGPRESFEWNELTDAQYDTSVVQDTGTVQVTYTRTKDTGSHFSEAADQPLNVTGIVGDGQPIDATSGLKSETSGQGNEGDFQWQFSDAVTNVTFNVNDIDGDGVVRITAFDENNQPIEVILNGGPNLTLIDTNTVAGNDTADSNGGYDDPNTPGYNLQVTIPGPVSKIVLEHDQNGPNNSGIFVTDIYFNAPGTPGTDGGTGGDDTIDGGAGDDVIFGEGGSDTITGGEGADTISGGGDDDRITVGSGDTASGDGGDDVFFVDTAGRDGPGTITIIGGETDEGGADTTNDNYPGAPLPVGDVLDLRGVALTNFAFDPTDPEAGTFSYLNADGEVITVTFSEIENVILPDVAPDGVVDGEEFGETMGPGYDDSNGPTDGGGDIIDGPDGLDDIIKANGGDDIIDAGLGNDDVDGGTGNDTIDGNVGSDTIRGGEGDDTITGGAGDDQLYGDAGNDTLTGGTGNDNLFGGTGSDTLNGGEGVDVLDGGADDDTLTVSSGDSALGGGGDDVFFVDPTNRDGPGSITITGGETDEGGADTTNDNYPGAPNMIGDVLDLRGVTLESFLPDGGDPASESGTFTYRNADNELITVRYTEIENVLLPDVGPDGVVDGEEFGETMGPGYDDSNFPTDGGGDIIDGPDGLDDIIKGNGGDDIIDAGLGNDDVDGGTGNDTIDGNVGNDTIRGGEGNDTLNGGAGTDTIFGGTGDDVIDGGTGNDALFGEAGNDIINGGDGDDQLNGGAGSDTLDGGEGGDLMEGGADDDTITVGAFDTARGEGGDDVFFVDPTQTTGPGFATILGGETDEGGADTTNDNYPGAPNMIGDVLDLRGVTLETFNPDGGDPASEGGFFSYRNADNELITVRYDEIENVLLPVGPGPVDGLNTSETMNPGYTDAQGDQIDGTDGNDDIIFGNGGDDIIDSGLGDDTVDGGAGDDTFDINDEGNGIDNDTIIGGETGETEGDTVDTSDIDDDLTVTLTAPETGTITDGTDTTTFSEIEKIVLGGGDDTVTGSDGDDNVDGGAGDDTIDGGDGNDRLIGGDGNDTVTGGDGDDFIDTSGGGAIPLPDRGFPGYDTNNDGDLFDPTDVPPIPADADPNDDKDVVFGGAGNDTIITGDDDDFIDGGDGDDTIDGGLDDDRILGGAGNDFIVGGEGSDEIDGGDGDDTIYGGLNPALPDALNLIDDPAPGKAPDPDPTNGQDIIRGGAGNDRIFGQDDDDILYGDDGDDLLDGGIDDDQLFGGEGNDTLIGGQGNDTLRGGPGFDTMLGGDDRDLFIDVNGGDIIDGGTGSTKPGDVDDFDTLNLRGLKQYDIIDNSGTGGDADGNSTSGRIVFRDGTTPDIIFSEIEEIVVCFTRGTMIMTAEGEKPIEELDVGDLIVTRDHGLQPMRWIGSRKVPAKGKLAPIRIKAGAMKNDRDLLVSPQHRMLVEGWRAELLFNDREVLAAAKHLVNGDTIFVDDGGEVEYFHMLFDRHELVIANGAWSESFHPGEMGFEALDEDAREEVLTLFPELREDAMCYGRAARESLKAHEGKVLADNPDFLL